MPESPFDASKMTDAEWRIWQYSQMQALTVKVDALGSQLLSHITYENAVASDQELRIRVLEKGQTRNNAFFLVIGAVATTITGLLIKLKGG